MFKKILAIFILFVVLLPLSSRLVAGQEATSGNVFVYLFSAKGCPHCAAEKEYLDKLVKEDASVVVREFEVSQSLSNAKLLNKVGKQLGADTSGIPFTVIGSKYFVGFQSADTTGIKISEAIEEVKLGRDTDVLGGLSELQPVDKPREDAVESSEPIHVSLPFLGVVNAKTISLPLLTFLIALLDGFNPCAMWVLLFLIGLLLGLKDKKRMMILGSTFILASTFVYFLFMTAWLNLFLLIGFVMWVRLALGGLATGVGACNVRDFFVNKDGGCKVTNVDSRRRVLDRLKAVAQRSELPLALLGMVLLAFSVNLIEAVCSAGLPAVYTNILALNNLPTWQYYMYILFYLFVFMLDDLFVFTVAVFSLKSVGIEGKYGRYSHLLGGLVMLAIGIAMLFKPELLMFG